jgi:hypothetical protein
MLSNAKKSVTGKHCKKKKQNRKNAKINKVGERESNDQDISI